MNFNFVDYCQYLLKSHTNFTITNLANHLENISHDTINRYLRTESLNSEDLWRNVKEEFVSAYSSRILVDRSSTLTLSELSISFKHFKMSSLRCLQCIES